jgi:hypothetical protein
MCSVVCNLVVWMEMLVMDVVVVVMVVLLVVR